MKLDLPRYYNNGMNLAQTHNSFDMKQDVSGGKGGPSSDCRVGRTDIWTTIIPLPPTPRGLSAAYSSNHTLEYTDQHALTPNVHRTLIYGYPKKFAVHYTHRGYQSIVPPNPNYSYIVILLYYYYYTMTVANFC